MFKRTGFFCILAGCLALIFTFSCLTNESGDGNDGADDESNFDSDANAYENCINFFENFSTCFGEDPDPETLGSYCSNYQDWEEIYGDNECVNQALSDFWTCLENIDCENYEDPVALFADVWACAEIYSQDVIDCFGGEPPDDDDDDNGDAPLLSNGYWESSAVEYYPQEDAWMSILLWDVCDPDNDLVDGNVFIYLAGTTESIVMSNIYWDDFGIENEDVSDCSEPLTVGIAIQFSDGSEPPYWGGVEICVDIEATDNAGNYSNLLTNICVYVP